MKIIFFLVLTLVTVAFCANEDFITTCLQVHNEERTALGIAPLTWSDDLASSALDWARSLASKNTLKHSTNRNHIGENIARTNSKSNSLEVLLEMWTDEQKYFINQPYPDCSRTGNKDDVSYYTQMIWQDTTEVGCGLATGFGRDYLVCQYNPSGNRKDHYAYDDSQTEVNLEARVLSPLVRVIQPIPDPNYQAGTSQVQMPQVQTPQVQNPEVQWQAPQVQNPQVQWQAPQVQIPQVQTPQVQTTAGESDSFIARCLELHNNERALLNIPGLTWAADLASTALSWSQQLAQKGSLSHSSGRVHIGENVSYTGSKPNSLDRLIGMWIDEKKYFIYGAYPNCSNTGDKSDVGHYTQLIWKETTELGCGVSTRNGRDFLVCQYRTSGNKKGKYPY